MGEKNKKDNKKESAKESNNVTVVLKTDLHCEGCASKIVKCLRSFDDVESVFVDESAKITVVGKVDPVKVKEKLEQKTHKKVELISPQPKKEKEKEKEKDNNNNKSNDKEDDKENAKANNNNNKKQGNSKNEGKGKDKDKNVKDVSKSEEKKGKAKEPPVTTAVFKVYLHCQGCIQKIHKLVSKSKGCEDVKIDKQKDLVTVTGAMDMKALAVVLKKHLKRDVDVVLPKKEEKKENTSGGGEKGKDGGKEKANGKEGDGGSKGKGNGGKEKGNGNGKINEPMEGNQMQVRYSYPNPNPSVYGLGSVVEPQFHYNPYTVGGFNAPQMFSDENPNACNVM